MLMDAQSDATADKSAVLAYVQNFLTQPATAPEKEMVLSPEQKANLQKSLFLKLTARLDQADARTREITKTLVTGLSARELSALFTDPNDLNSLDNSALDALAAEVRTTTQDALERKSRQDELLRKSREQNLRRENELEQFISTEAALDPTVETEQIAELSNYFTQTDTGILEGITENGLEVVEAELNSPSSEPSLETDTERRKRWQQRLAEDEMFEERLRAAEKFASEQAEEVEVSFEEVQEIAREVEKEELEELMMNADEAVLTDILNDLEAEDSPQNQLEKERQTRFDEMYARREDEINRKLEQTLGPKLLSELVVNPKEELARSMRNVSNEDLAREETISTFLQEDISGLVVETLVDKPLETKNGALVRSALTRINELLTQPNIFTSGLEDTIQEINTILDPEADSATKSNKIMFEQLSNEALVETMNNPLLRNKLDRLSEKITTRVLERFASTETPDNYPGTTFVLEREIPVTETVETSSAEPEFRVEALESFFEAGGEYRAVSAEFLGGEMEPVSTKPSQHSTVETSAVRIDTAAQESSPDNTFERELPLALEEGKDILDAVTQDISHYQTLSSSEQAQVRAAILDTIDPEEPMSDLQVLAYYDNLGNPDALRPVADEDLEIDETVAEEYPGLEIGESREVFAKKQEVIDKALGEMEEDGFWLRKNDEYNEAYQEIFYSNVVDYLNSMPEDRQFYEEQNNGELAKAIDNLRVEGIVQMVSDTVRNPRYTGYTRWVGKEFNKLVVNRGFQIPKELTSVSQTLQENKAQELSPKQLTTAVELLVAAKRLRTKSTPVPPEFQELAPATKRRG